MFQSSAMPMLRLQIATLACAAASRRKAAASTPAGPVTGRPVPRHNTGSHLSRFGSTAEQQKDLTGVSTELCHLEVRMAEEAVRNPLRTVVTIPRAPRLD